MIKKLIVLSVFLVACGNPEQNQEPGTKEKTYVSKTVVYSIDPSETRWHQLTVTDTGSYIRIPCDAENKQLSFEAKEGKTILTYLSGQAADQYEVIEVKQESPAHYIYKCRPAGSEDEKSSINFDVRLKDAIAYWTLTSNDIISFIPEENLGDYKTYKQPCRECWGDDESMCDETKRK